MAADKVYLAVPTLTAFVLVRNALLAGREYTNTQTGAVAQRVETESKRVEVTFTTYQPVVNEAGEVIRYTDLGDDTFVFPEKAPTQQTEAGGEPVTIMSDVIDDDLLKSLRDVLVEVMTGAIPDFATQPSEVAAIAVPRYFNIDRIGFTGRSDKPREASLKILLGVYADQECKILKRYIQQDFVSGAILSDMAAQLDSFVARIASIDSELAASTTTNERKATLAAERSQLIIERDKLQAGLNDLQSLSLVLSKPVVKTAIKQLTANVLEDCVAKSNLPSLAAYKDINVQALVSRFDAAFSGLQAAIT